MRSSEVSNLGCCTTLGGPLAHSCLAPASDRILRSASWAHAIAGVEGVYDRHSYRDEKAIAVKDLTALIDRIINAPADNVVLLEARQ